MSVEAKYGKGEKVAWDPRCDFPRAKRIEMADVWAAASVENGKIVHVRCVAKRKRDGGAAQCIHDAAAAMFMEPRLPQTHIGILALPEMVFYSHTKRFAESAEPGEPAAC